MADKKRKSCIKGGRGCAAAWQVYVPATGGTPPAGETFDVRNSLRLAQLYLFIYPFFSSFSMIPVAGGGDLLCVCAVEGVRWAAGMGGNTGGPYATLGAARGPLGVTLWDELSHKSTPPFRGPLPANLTKTVQLQKTLVQ